MMTKTFLILAFWMVRAICPYPSTNHQKIPESMVIEYQPIGEFHSALTPRTGAPRQGSLQPDNEATIEIFHEYRDALTDLEQYEYIIVLYHLHLSNKWHSNVRPPRSKRSFGLFATRSPNRPNPIGFSVVRLEKIRDNVLHVRGIDAFDGTPVLDIKPWIRSIDCPGGGSQSELEEELGLDLD
jgi:tRNA-Thr(GGU) m(6)t(6)A37 methyltransferase TsaA